MTEMTALLLFFGIAAALVAYMYYNTTDYTASAPVVLMGILAGMMFYGVFI